MVQKTALPMVCFSIKRNEKYSEMSLIVFVADHLSYVSGVKL